MPARRKAVSWRSGLEDQTAGDLDKRGIPYRYEDVKLRYERPPSSHTYLPDFVLDNGIVVETKGRFELDDRKKHLWIKNQHPDLDIRFIFTRSQSPLKKGAKSSYADWCKKYGFIFSDAPRLTKAERDVGASKPVVPQSWADEPPCERRLQALKRATA